MQSNSSNWKAVSNVNTMSENSGAQEQQLLRSDFGVRLKAAMDAYGPLCMCVDPHRSLLTDWGYNIDAEGAELFCMRMLQATNGRVAAVKFQTSLFERFGSAGFEALERVLYVARQTGVITIVDCLHGGHATIVRAIVDAYCKPTSPMLADAITLLPYYGVHSLDELINVALDNGRGVFITSLASNQESVDMQTAIRQTGKYQGKSVSYGIAHDAQEFNQENTKLGSVGLILGSSISELREMSSSAITQFTGPILSSGFRGDDDQLQELQEVFRNTHGNVLLSVCKGIAKYGPDIASLSQAAERISLDIRQILMNETSTGEE